MAVEPAADDVETAPQKGQCRERLKAMTSVEVFVVVAPIVVATVGLVMVVLHHSRDKRSGP